MRCLGITSAVSTIGAAVVDDKGVIAQSLVAGKEARSENLVSMIDIVLKQAEISVNKLDCISVVKGPGSYSGLRGGLAVAKSFSATLNIPIIGVSTMETVAYNFIDTSSTVVVAIHACKDDYNIALFVSDGISLKRLSDDLVVKFDRLVDLMKDIEGRIILASDEKVYDEVMKKSNNNKIIFAEAVNAIPSAVSAANLGVLKVKSGEKDDYLSLSPEYSHKPNIREYKKK